MAGDPGSEPSGPGMRWRTPGRREEGGRGCPEATLTKKGPCGSPCRERCLHDGVCLTTVRRAEGVAKREELAVKRPGEPLFWHSSEEHPLPFGDVHSFQILITSQVQESSVPGLHFCQGPATAERTERRKPSPVPKVFADQRRKGQGPATERSGSSDGRAHRTAILLRNSAELMTTITPVHYGTRAANGNPKRAAVFLIHREPGCSRLSPEPARRGT